MEAATHSISKAIWGLSWEKHLPVQAGDYTIHHSSFEEFERLKKLPGTFLQTSDVVDNGFLKDHDNQSKTSFLNVVSDFFLFKKGEEVVGMGIADMHDWTTYYIRYIYISKAHRFHGLNNHFSQLIETVCSQYRIDKLLCEVAPSNVRQVSRLSEVGWIYCGSTMSERFGVNLRLTKFLNPKAQDVFKKSFTLLYESQSQPDETTSSINQRGIT